MCRITGFLDTSEVEHKSNESIGRRMRDCMTYGGPDAGGLFVDKRKNLVLGHRRLSVIDLSDAANQPMHFRNLVLVFNGELYNYQEVQKSLLQLGREFSTGSDTEVLLQAWDEWGPKAIERFRGMFAFAIWDTQKQVLTLCRDRLGVKPMYWFYHQGVFMFASELKAFHQHPRFEKSIDLTALSLFLQQGYIPAPYSIFQKTRKLQAGHFLEIKANGEWRTWSYWSAEEIYRTAKLHQANENELIHALESQLEESFELRMVADVPVGLFLSGGIDSSLLAAILQKKYSTPLKTFTIGFEQEGYNEAEHAKAIAKHLGTEHYEHYCTVKELLDLIPRLPDFCDEPFGDTSVFPTYLLSKMARKEVIVSLSADGADELFGGYTRYDISHRWFPKIQKWPLYLRKRLGSLLSKVDPFWLEKNKQFIPGLSQYKQLPHKLHKLQQSLSAKDQLDFFIHSAAYNQSSILRKLGIKEAPRYQPGDLALLPKREISLFGLIDLQTYLEGDILTKVDRASMQCALEARDPFLDHHLVEWAMALPDEYKIRNGQSKYLLRKILYQYVPPSLIDRPKQGFSVPMREWLLQYFKAPLQQMARDTSFANAFSLNEKYIQQLVENFTENQKFVDHHLIWFLFVLFQWQKRWL